MKWNWPLNSTISVLSSNIRQFLSMHKILIQSGAISCRKWITINVNARILPSFFFFLFLANSRSARKEKIIYRIIRATVETPATKTILALPLNVEFLYTPVILLSICRIVIYLCDSRFTIIHCGVIIYLYCLINNICLLIWRQTYWEKTGAQKENGTLQIDWMGI